MIQRELRKDHVGVNHLAVRNVSSRLEGSLTDITLVARVDHLGGRLNRERAAEGAFDLG